MQIFLAGPRKKGTTLFLYYGRFSDLMEVVFEIQRNSRTSRLSFYITRLWKQESYND